MLIISGTLTPPILKHSLRKEGCSLSGDLDKPPFPSADQLGADV